MPRSEDRAMRRQAEDVLHNSEERIRLILDSATEAICGCDSEGTCLFSSLAVDNHILRLRQKLESDPSHPSHLLTVHTVGYKFVP